MVTHAWRYFELHANQRMSVFNFFLVLSGFVAAGLAASFQGSGPLPLIGVMLGFVLTLVSFVFWKLDQRVSFLVKHAEQALAELEGSFSDPKARLFAAEPDRTKEAQATGLWPTRQWTYGDSFRFVFVAMGVMGVIGAILSFSRYFDWVC